MSNGFISSCKVKTRKGCFTEFQMEEISSVWQIPCKTKDDMPKATLTAKKNNHIGKAGYKRSIRTCKKTKQLNRYGAFEKPF